MGTKVMVVPSARKGMGAYGIKGFKMRRTQFLFCFVLYFLDRFFQQVFVVRVYYDLYRLNEDFLTRVE